MIELSLILGFVIFIILIYILEKLIYRPMIKDKWKKITISYYIDKYLFRKESKIWGSND